MGSNNRFPCSPADYKIRHKVGPKEMMIDYDNEYPEKGPVYFTDKEGNEHDLVEIVSKSIQETGGKDIELNIENYGKVTLEDFLNIINNKSNSNVQIIRTATKPVYVQKDNVLDESSIVADKTRHKIFLYGFDEAPVGSYPIKGEDGKLLWVSRDSNGNTITATDKGTENPKDGLIHESIVQNVTNNKVYLQASVRQKTMYPITDFKVILPNATQDEFCQIMWHIRTGDYAPNIAFPSNCLWISDKASIVSKNNLYVFTFITYDHGGTWMCEKKVFNNFSQTVYDTNYSEDDYYTVLIKKDELEDK